MIELRGVARRRAKEGEEYQWKNKEHKLRDYAESFQYKKIYFFASHSYTLAWRDISFFSLIFDRWQQRFEYFFVRNRLMTFLFSFFYTLFFIFLTAMQKETIEPDDSWLRIWFVIVNDRTAPCSSSETMTTKLFFLRFTEAKKEVEKLFKFLFRCEERKKEERAEICVYICCLSLFSTSVI